MWFSCFRVLPGSAEAKVIWGGIVKHLLIAYFIGNISVKKYQNPFMCVKAIASQRWDVFWDTVYNNLPWNTGQLRQMMYLTLQSWRLFQLRPLFWHLGKCSTHKLEWDCYQNNMMTTTSVTDACVLHATSTTHINLSCVLCQTGTTGQGGFHRTHAILTYYSARSGLWYNGCGFTQNMSTSVFLS